jgi:hypothetical protein
MTETPPIPPDEQIQAVLFHEPHQDIAWWSLKRLGLPESWRDTNVPGNAERCADAVKKAVTVTRADVDAYLEKNAVRPESWQRTAPGSEDGSYLVQSPDGWRFYTQERGHAFFELLFPTLPEARKYLVNLRLGPWLQHLHVPCTTSQGPVTD